MTIELDQVAIGYGTPLLPPLSLTVGEGEVWGIVGPNGAGKTTLVKTIIGLVAPLGGTVDLGTPPPRFGYVPQRHELNPEFPLTAHEVARMGRFRLPGSRREHARRVTEELDRLQVGHLARARFSSLSGGQQQRVLIARALSADPTVLVLDEPTQGMDAPGEKDILAFLQAVHADRHVTILMIGHHIEKVASVATHLCLVNKDTKLFRSGPVDEILTCDALSEAYGRAISVSKHHGQVHVEVEEGRCDDA